MDQYPNNLIQCAETRNEFDYLDDGYQYWFPTNNQGGLTSTQLRIIADELDRRNHKWNQQVQEYFTEHEPEV